MLSALDTVKVRSKTFSESATEGENSSKCILTDPTSETKTTDLESSGTSTETVRESVERENTTTAEARIRKEMQERFPYALAAACTVLAELDAEYRKWKGEQEQGEISGIYIPLSADFPLSERFVNPTSLYISSLLLIGINEDVSDKFFEKYADDISHIASEIPYISGKTAERYYLR